MKATMDWYCQVHTTAHDWSETLQNWVIYITSNDKVEIITLRLFITFKLNHLKGSSVFKKIPLFYIVIAKTMTTSLQLKVWNFNWKLKLLSKLPY